MGMPLTNKIPRHSLRRAALRSAIAASRPVSTTTRITLFAVRTTVECNAARTASAQGLRFFSQTVRKASDVEDKALEEAQRKSEQDFERQVVDDARQDVEVHLGHTRALIQGWKC